MVSSSYLEFLLLCTVTLKKDALIFLFSRQEIKNSVIDTTYNVWRRGQTDRPDVTIRWG